MFLSVAFLAAGKGTRFSSTGQYDVPKILVPVNGVPMSVRSYQNLMRTCLLSRAKENDIFNPIFAITDDFEKKYPEYKETIEKTMPDVPVDFHIQKGYVAGPAMTADELKNKIPEDAHLLLSNVDQLVEGNILEDIKTSIEEDFDGVIFCFESNEDRYSYVTTDENDVATSMIEKEVVSDKASSGHIFFKKAETLFSWIDAALRENKHKPETYISDVCNEAIKGGVKFKVSMLKSFTDMGTPSDIEKLES